MTVAPHRRSAVVDLGSNSVRLVVFDGISRNPISIFNEKSVLRLGRGLNTTGRLNEEGVGMAMEVMDRFHAIARGMDADPFEILATAAVRDASNGPEFVAALRARMPGVPIRILSGEEEADYSATGVLCGLPEADGLVADIGGGSLELIQLSGGQKRDACTLRLGVIRLSDRSGGDLQKARSIADADIAQVGWLDAVRGRPLYLVGGAFRALARLQIARTNYPLNIVHLYTLGEDDAREMGDWIAGSSRRALERLPGAPRKRLEDVPFAATVLRRLMRRVQPSSLVFCVDGLREGWYMRRVAASVGGIDPQEAVAQEMCARLGRSATLPDRLMHWTAPLFPDEAQVERRLRRAACLMSDIGSYDHPEYRAEQTYLRVLRMQGVGFDHPARAFVALTLAIRYEAELGQDFLHPSRQLLTDVQFRHAVILGLALRLAYTVCGGTEELLDGTGIGITDQGLALHLTAGRTAVRGESVRRRLDRLGDMLSIPARIVEGGAA
ncbi:Ppx/GppA family phosphatase [Gluconacetobacter azotocaptans]|uniref:Ppx/GppA family phosphatase n=1 Tax=Gluconacetobacter azotocaptans TaxID=142834 RepID=A0A7W4JS15_9PROT|nr:Ppx/GppA family phosphatase [Gluconacetobacter azotocaptans]MBB2189819.1 Ppx/GppA family phosphatase [Gluconacetobacter azotocaptans]MBM9402175.1 Ppx/GppA family phosphatase [Gluconacetobacter azotocaptans]GBQ37592.1 exopolyphosphatase [Gluconacetobacter azotocaptans DSM 13594]